MDDGNVTHLRKNEKPALADHARRGRVVDIHDQQAWADADIGLVAQHCHSQGLPANLANRRGVQLRSLTDDGQIQLLRRGQGICPGGYFCQGKGSAGWGAGDGRGRHADDNQPHK
jgi:hypothetical protein